MGESIFGLTELAEAPAIGDLFALTDISDTAQSANGSTRKNKAQYALGAQVNPQTGTTYTYLTTDFRKLVTHTNAGAIAGTLPQAGASFPAGWYMLVQNRGAGALTITPTTSTIDGAASITLNQNEGTIIVSDGTNYFTLRGKATGAAGVGDVVGPGSATDNAVVRYDSTTGKLIQDSNLTLPDDAASTEVGYMNIPQNSQSVDYTAVIADRGKHLFHPSSDNNPRTFTIPANASVAFAIGTAITFVNKINTLTIAITSDTLTWAEDGTTGSRTLAANGIATALKITATEWLIAGTGLT